jgi:phage shock protein A
MRTATALAELKKLVRVAKENLYRRIELAAAVLSDLDWIAKVHGGSDIKAQDALQAEFFPDLGGYLSLGKLVEMFRTVAKSKWEEVRFDIAAVEVIYDDSRGTTEERGKRTSWKAIAAERLARIEQLEKQAAELTEACAKLRDENKTLVAQVARLEGRIEEMRRGRREREE